MSGLYRGVTTLLEPFVPLVAPLIDPGEERIHADRTGQLSEAAGGLWLHAASAGEVQGLSPLAAAFPGTLPLLVTAQTAAGAAAAGIAFPDRPVHRAPYDLPGVMRRAFQRSAVDALIVTETELWPNQLDEAARRSRPVALVNARLSDRAISRYRLTRRFWRARLERLRAIAAQSDEDAARFRELGARPEVIAVTGSMKHDRPVGTVAPAATTWARKPLLVLGSVRPGEESLLAAALEKLRANHPGLRLVVAPRHRDHDDAVAAAFTRSGWRVARRSAGEPDDAHDLLLLDTMGELGGFYLRADGAFVGGTLRSYGGHNIAEPAGLGIPVLFGPSTENCRLEAATLLKEGGGVVAGDVAALAAGFESFLDTQARARSAAGAERAAADLRGATRRTLDHLRRLGFPHA